MPSPIPRQDRWELFARPSHRLRLSLDSRRVSSCITRFGACTAFTRLRPTNLPSRQSDPLHQRLQQLRYLCYCSDCYRVERTSSRVGLLPLWTSAFSRRTRILGLCDRSLLRRGGRCDPDRGAGPPRRDPGDRHACVLRSAGERADFAGRSYQPLELDRERGESCGGRRRMGGSGLAGADETLEHW
jgi:hypothetical protein